MFLQASYVHGIWGPLKSNRLILQAMEGTSQLVPGGGCRQVTASFRSNPESRFLQARNQGGLGSQPGTGFALTRGVQHGIVGPTSVPPWEAFGRRMPSAATSPHQPGALRSGVPATHCSLAHSLHIRKT